MFFGGRKRLAFNKHVQFLSGNGFALDKGLGDAVQLVDIFRENLCAALVGFLHDTLYFGVYETGRVLTVILVLDPLPADEDFLAGFADGERADGIAHTPFSDHLAGQLGDAFDVVGSAGGDILENDFLSHTAAEEDNQVIAQEVAGIAVAVLAGKLHGDAEGASSRDNAHLVHRIRSGKQLCGEGVPAFVIGGDALLLIGEDEAAAFTAHEDFVFGEFEVGHVDFVLVQLGCLQGGFVDKVFQFGTRESGCGPGDDIEVNVLADGSFLGVYDKDLLAAGTVRGRDNDLTVEAPGTQEGGV